MIRYVTIGLVGLGIVLGSYSAQAGGKYYKGSHHGYGGYHYGFKGWHHKRGHHGDIGDEILIGAGIIGGSILLGNVLSRPQYPAAPAYYASPRTPYCVQDQVYRYLPDGRIQWGTRTRCF